MPWAFLVVLYNGGKKKTGETRCSATGGIKEIHTKEGEGEQYVAGFRFSSVQEKKKKGKEMHYKLDKGLREKKGRHPNPVLSAQPAKRRIRKAFLVCALGREPAEEKEKSDRVTLTTNHAERAPLAATLRTTKRKKQDAAVSLCFRGTQKRTGGRRM